MADYEIFYDVTFTDINGDTARTQVASVNADTATLAGINTTAQTLASDLQACSNAKVTAIGMHVTFTKAQISAATAPPPASATYPSVTDGAKLSFAASSGSRRQVTVPAPLLSDFKTDTNTVNPDDANVSTLIADIEAFSDLSGATNLYEGGVKVGRHSRRRVSRKSL